MSIIFLLATFCLLTDLYAPISGCDLKASKKIFHDDSGIPWSCRDFCPTIRGCLEKCCPPNLPPKAPEPPVPKPPVTERVKTWPIAFPCFVAGCLLIAAVWKLLKDRRNNSDRDVEEACKEDAETVSREDAETVSREDAETVSREDAETVSREDAETVSREDAETVSREDAETVSREDAETVQGENFIQSQHQYDGEEHEELMQSIQETPV